MVDRQAEIFSRMSAQEKLDLAQKFRQTNIELLEAGIRQRQGDLSPETMRLEVLRHILPPRLFKRFYEPRP